MGEQHLIVKLTLSDSLKISLLKPSLIFYHQSKSKLKKPIKILRPLNAFSRLRYMKNMMFGLNFQRILRILFSHPKQPWYINKIMDQNETEKKKKTIPRERMSLGWQRLNLIFKRNQEKKSISVKHWKIN